MFEVTCKECGKKYFSDKNSDGYCEVCRSCRIAKAKHKYYEKRKNDRKRVKGTLVKCEKCGTLFSPVNSAQTLCEKCQYIKEKEYKMTASNNYRKENNDVIQFKVKKGERDKLKSYAKENGMNVTELITAGISFLKAYNSLPLDKQKEIDEILNTYAPDNDDKKT